MLTPFGQFIRKKRIEKYISLKDMADALGVSSAFLSGMEMGRKSIPEDSIPKISDFLHLSPSEKKELLDSIELSKRTVKIELEGFSLKSRETAIAFARKFSELSEEDADLLSNFLKTLEEKKK